MPPKPISYEKLSGTLTISERHRTCENPQGFWIYDDLEGMNIAMAEPTAQAAFVKAIKYYQDRLSYYRTAYNDLKTKVDNFVELFVEQDEE